MIEGSAWGRNPPFLPRTIPGLAIGFTCLTCLVLLLIGVLTFSIVDHQMEWQIARQISGESAALLSYENENEHGLAALVSAVKQRENPSDLEPSGPLTGEDDKFERDTQYLVTDSTGRRLAGQLRSGTPAPGWSYEVPFDRKDGSRSDALVLSVQLKSGGLLVVAAERAAIHQTHRLLFQLFGLAIALLLLLGTVMVFLVRSIMKRRLASIEETASLIIAGDLSRRIPVDESRAELRSLSMRLNQMLDKIGERTEAQRVVFNGLAHDLRTPLSRIYMMLEQAAAQATSPAQRNLLKTAIDESDGLLDLFTGLLAVAEIDGRHVRARFQRVDLAQAVTEIAEACRPAFDDAAITLTVDVKPTLVLGDRMLLQRLAGNILDNVLKHAREASSATVSLREQDGRAILQITDDGPGIPAMDRARAFESLVRLRPDESPPGHGLGLSLVRAIASAHDGAIRIAPDNERLVFEFEMAAVVVHLPLMTSLPN